MLLPSARGAVAVEKPRCLRAVCTRWFPDVLGQVFIGSWHRGAQRSLGEILRRGRSDDLKVFLEARSLKGGCYRLLDLQSP